MISSIPRRYISSSAGVANSNLLKNILGLTPEQIHTEISPLLSDVKPYISKQIFQWIYKKGCTDFKEMSNLSLETRSILSQNFNINYGNTETSQLSNDGTRKLLFDLSSVNSKNATAKLPPSPKKELVETVFIPEDNRGTLCVSSQIGCALNCKFCHTGTQKFMRNLSAADIVGQYMSFAHFYADFNLQTSVSPKSITNIVFMGQGEPLLNFSNLKQAINLLTRSDGINFPTHKITVSTSGIAPLIEKVATELNVQLAISLHATDDSLRNKIMPINRSYPLATLFDSIRKFIKASESKNSRITFEYVLLDKVNDFHGDAVRLAKLIGGIKSHVNLIPFNPWPGSIYKCSPKPAIDEFLNVLLQKNISASVRKPRGLDIMAACGQLKSSALSKMEKKTSPPPL
ncbi:Dual-specificity RNA methyltransferase RlmN [Smittium culicis]|uniref:Dual-specificity RNA methyltransferase RlmN n=1 Tax=Smittium culicis TaxID=133412 RepID=A0A1R1YMT0_9FUNG|nr:Dual-specificity RNA methyltransferase RlmN [Smittium culicis]